MQEFTQKVIKVIKSIPKGKIATYGLVASMAGNKKAARQVARILHTCAKKENLPWHRVVNKQGKIVIKNHESFLLQKDLLKAENIEFINSSTIDVEKYLWNKIL